MTSAALDPITNPQAWDVVRIAGIQSPGICTLSGFERSYEWDKKKGKGAAGETLTFVQLPAASGSITFTVWRREDFAALVAFRALFKYDPTKKSPSPLDIYYPSLADLDIKSVVTEDISPILHVGKQKYQFTVKLIEYRPPPPKPAVVTPSGSKSNAGGPGKPGTPTDPIADAQQAEIAKLLAEAKKP